MRTRRLHSVRCKRCGSSYTGEYGPRTIIYQCPKCTQSPKEEEIAALLDYHGLEYVRQKTFKGLRHISALKIDFYLPAQRFALEYDGSHHWRNVYGDLDLVKQRDAAKTKWCRENGISLIRISDSSTRPPGHITISELDGLLHSL